MTVIDRFLKYIAIETTSTEDIDTIPTSQKEFDLARVLVAELKQLGAEDVVLTDNCYVYAHLSPNCDCNTKAIGFIAHLDTSPDVSGSNIKAKVIDYEGGDIIRDNGIITRAADFKALSKLIGHQLIISDGTTLLGADDKAGVSEIMTMVEYLLAHPEIPHGYIGICFTPDEEVGLGTSRFEMDNFPCDYAYTVDGGGLGEIEYENFNAASVKVVANGLNIHPGSAKNLMKNALLMANEFISLFPQAESPAHTEGYEGFYHFNSIQADESKAMLSMIIRDHDYSLFEKRKQFVQDVSDFLNCKYGPGSFEIEITDTYYNMKELILPHKEILERAEKAFRKAGISTSYVPIRGGTDGAMLSYQGLPCPNLSTGGGNFHSIHEYASVNEMEKMVEVLINIATSL